MKKLLLLLGFTFLLFSCGSDSDSGSCMYNGHVLYVGEQGGCYYINSNGNKEYVDRVHCSGCN